MTFSFSLLGALLLLLPGFAGYFGLRVGETAKLLTPRPDRPNSTLTIFLVAAIALGAHTAGALAFALNELLVRQGWVLIPTSYDPDPYVAFLGGHLPSRSGSVALALWLLYSFVLSLAAGWICQRLAPNPRLKRLSDPLRFGWLLPMVREVEQGRIVIAYVMTNLGEGGSWIAYEGIVRRLSLDEDTAIEMLVLEQCDRFLVKIEGDRVSRRASADTGAQLIAMMQFRAEQIANVAFELIEVEDSDPEED